MRKLAVIVMGAALMAAPAFAQPMNNSQMQGATPAPSSQMPMNQAPMSQGAMPMQGSAQAERPMHRGRPMHRDRMDRRAMRGDHMAPQGDVNAAYMGGGVILQGAPGAPAPMPEPTPPGQRPANMVPLR